MPVISFLSPSLSVYPQLIDPMNKTHQTLRNNALDTSMPACATASQRSQGNTSKVAAAVFLLAVGTGFATTATAAYEAGGGIALDETGVAIGSEDPSSGGNPATADGPYAISVGSFATATGEQATAVGASANANGTGATALGTFANASGRGATASGSTSIANGNGATAQGLLSRATGNGATASGAYANANGVGATATGARANANGAGATAYGPGAKANGASALAVGENAAATGANALSVGPGSSANGDNATAIGFRAMALQATGVALGAGSVADRAGMSGQAEAFSGVPVGSTQGALSVGSVGNERQITNVAGGTQPTDAVNVRQLTAAQNQLQSQLDGTRRIAYSGVAMATAMSTLPQAMTPGKALLSVGVGSYSGYSALAFGYSARSQGGKWIYKVNGALSGEKFNVGLGVGYEFD
ncbi:YadA family autotransporter adhesin [Variovorax sp. GB1P17]|uniref:YadA family autotransporter adhesin n=1 Tax=Variovorax sp. GB1P17 TaxID=3443740 RepID=UPI003F48E97D